MFLFCNTRSSENSEKRVKRLILRLIYCVFIHLNEGHILYSLQLQLYLSTLLSGSLLMMIWILYKKLGQSSLSKGCDDLHTVCICLFTNLTSMSVWPSGPHGSSTNGWLTPCV